MFPVGVKVRWWDDRKHKGRGNYWDVSQLEASDNAIILFGEGRLGPLLRCNAFLFESTFLSECLVVDWRMWVLNGADLP